MKLGLGLCYAVLLSDGTVVEFRLTGSKGGKVLVEVPPGSGKQADLYGILNKGVLAYWEIECP
jgi:hypothetical protein